jgi:DNA-binding response OmpR family regulator
MRAGRVLVVEDDEAIRLLLQEALSSRGYEIFEAVDGLSAVPAALDCRPDAVLLDVGLPGMDGFAVLARLKEDEGLRDVPVLMVTAWADPVLVTKALDRGAADHLRKPFDLADLDRRLAAALDPPRAAEAGGAAVHLVAGKALEEPVAAAVERRLRAVARGGDVVTREPDGSFVVTVRGADAGAAAAVGRRMQEAVAARPVDTAGAAVRVRLQPVGHHL